MNYMSHITAVLGATNTGKTHYAVERMCARSSGVIGLPLRLLAREVYDKICRIKGPQSCALITGEEKIIPPHARYFVCTVEAMPMGEITAGKFACVVIDEVQMMAHKERGHIFTDRVLRARGNEETLLLGADTVYGLLHNLIPKIRFVTRERFSVLSFTGHTKLNRLPKRSVIVAFSIPEVYALAELIRRHYGGAALVMGALSPRTRNAQAALYQSGEVDYLVATDAIGMGLNLDADHVAFASLRKFDGQRKRYLYASEIAQIAGRAGRFRKDGSFGTTGNCLPIDNDVVARIENHHFTPLQKVEWRNTTLDFSSLEALQNSLAKPPQQNGLRRIAPPPDEMVLTQLINIYAVNAAIKTPKDVKLLWEICQIPDFRNLGPEAHMRLLENIFTSLTNNTFGLAHDYLENNINRLDHIEGSVDILSSRLSSMRTWAYIAHKASWVKNTDMWVNHAKSVEERLSDALHNKLVAQFVDRRTSALLKGIGAKTRMDVTITDAGMVMAEGHMIGRLTGLLFTASETQGELDTKAVHATAAIALAPEIDRRFTQITGCPHDALTLSDQGEIIWNNSPIAKLVTGKTLLNPKIEIIGGELGSAVLREQAFARASDYLRTEITQKFENLNALKTFCDDPDSHQDARPLAHILYENHGMVERLQHLQLIKDTDQTARGYLRNMSVQIAYHHVFLRDMLKPASARLLSIFYAYAWDKDGGGNTTPFLPANGMASTPDDKTYPETSLNKAGYTRKGPRIIRFDILARLAQMLMQATKEVDGKPFRIAQEMMALLGCSYDDFEGVLEGLGYKKIVTPLDTHEQEQEAKALHEFVALLKQAGKGTPTTNTDGAKTETASDNSKQTPAKDKGKKNHWQSSLTIYRPRPECAEDSSLIVPTSIDLWQFNFKKRPFKAKEKPSKPYKKSAKPKANHAAKTKVEPMKPEDSPFAALAGLNLDTPPTKKDQ